MNSKKGKLKRERDQVFQSDITDRIRMWMVERGWNQEDICAKAMIDTGTFSKLMKGKERAWNLDHLKKIARAFGYGLKDLWKEPIKAPIVGEIVAGKGPDYYEAMTGQEPLGWQEIILEGDKDTLAQIYCLKVSDPSLMPAFLPGSTIVAQKETSDTIRDGTMVVYVDPEGMTQVRQIFIKSTTIILHSLTQGVEDIVLPRKYLASCDRILRQEYPSA